MKEILNLKTKTTSTNIYVGAKNNFAFELIGSKKTVIITDKNIYNLYPDIFHNQKCLVIEPLESEKNIENVVKIWKFLLENEIDKNSFILGIGGGLVCDITGFVASTFKRGVKFGYIATTLLAQVDASIGGKNGINFYNIKNCIGLIKQPEFIISDIEMLKTLDNTEFLCGIAECIKIACISDDKFFDFIDQNAQSLSNHDTEIIQKCITWAVKLKIKYVEKDENETSIRKELNFGHTLAHSLETMYNLKHGLAVARGMIFSTQLAVNKNICKKKDYQKLYNLLIKFNLPVNFKYDSKKILNNIIHDKKKSANSIDFVFIKKIGKAQITNIKYEELKIALNDLC